MWLSASDSYDRNAATSFRCAANATRGVNNVAPSAAKCLTEEGNRQLCQEFELRLVDFGSYQDFEWFSFLEAVQEMTNYNGRAQVNLGSLRQLPAATVNAQRLVRESAGMVVRTIALFETDNDKAQADEAIERVGLPSDQGGDDSFVQELLSQLPKLHRPLLVS